jgi:hypothetical protein
MTTSEQGQANSIAPNSELASGQDELTEAGAISISIYQNQMMLVHRIWAQFTFYSTLIIFFSVIANLFRWDGKLKFEPVIWLLPLLGFLVFLGGNYRTLTLSVDELQLMRSQAIAESGMDLRGVQPMVSKRLHFFASVGVILIYGAAWLIP